MDSQLVAALLPFLPGLVQGQPSSQDLSQPGWKKAEAIWGRLSPVLEAKAAGKEAISDLLSDPEYEDNQEALRLQIKKRLRQDAVLKKELAALLEQFPQTNGGVQINQKVSGSGNQVIGQVTGGMVIGNVSGANVVVGPNSQQTVAAPIPNAPAAPVEETREAVKTILVVTANPQGSTQLQLPREVREIGEIRRGSSQRDQFRIVQCPAARIKDLRQALLDHEPYLVHFSGHGVGHDAAGLGSVTGQRKISRVPEGEERKAEPEGIVLEDVVGQPKLVSAQALAGLFQLFEDSMQVVVLNSCYSAVQAEEIGKHIPFVVGMRRAIGDNAAIAFAKGFYEGLFAGRSVQAAFEFGKNSIQLESIPEELTPVFKCNEALVKATESGAGQRGGEAAGGVNVREMSGGAVVGEAESVVMGDAIDARGAQGVVNRPGGDVNMQFGNSSVVNTEGGDFAGGDLHK